MAGWRFAKSDEKLPGENVTPDPIHKDFTHLRDIYFNVNPDYEGRFTVPTLYDKKQNKIVSNEVFIEIEVARQKLISTDVVKRDHPHVLHRIRRPDLG